MSNAPDPGTEDPLSLTGIIPPTVTAFNENESIDHETTADHARYVVDGGCHGVFPCGTNGEFAFLTGDERQNVVETVVEEVGHDVPVIPGVGAPSTRETIDHAEHAEWAGADGIVAVTPYYYPLDHDAYLQHYERICAAVDIPVYIYHIPSKTGNSISLETLGELANIDNLAGVKDSSKEIPWLGQAIDRNPELTFMAGSDSLLYPGLEIGCAGLVSAVADVFPEFAVELYDAFDAGDEQRAKALQSKLFDVRSALKRGSYMAGVKTALDLTGFDAGPMRSPLRLMDRTDKAMLKADLVELGML